MGGWGGGVGELVGNLGQAAGRLLIRLVCTESPAILFSFLSYMSARQFLTYAFFKPQLFTALFVWK